MWKSKMTNIPSHLSAKFKIKGILESNVDINYSKDTQINCSI